MLRIFFLKNQSFFEALFFFFGILIFASFLQFIFPWNFLCLTGVVLSFAVVTKEINSVKDFAVIFDLKRSSDYLYYFLIISVLFGLFWGLVFRHFLNIPIIPLKLKYFALIAMTIGSVEELIFRGYIQRKLRNLGIVVSILGASLMHTTYKCFIFLILPAIHPTNFFYLFVWTLGVGCISGILKEFSGNTIVPVSGHAVFDLLVYGDGIVDRWWVWL